MDFEEAEGAGVSNGRRAVFLDRDGTIIYDADYLTSPDEIRLMPGAPEALRRLRDAGFLLLVVTNQSAIARGWLTEARLKEIHGELNSRLRPLGAEIDAFYHCPHFPEGSVMGYAVECECRKPKPGMLHRAAKEWDADLGRSYMVGDSERDVEAGRMAGCFSILVGSPVPTRADARTADLSAAADVILRRERQS